MHERNYGDKNYRPGDDWEGKKSISTKFEKDLNDIEIEILGFFNPRYLDKYNTTQSAK